MPTPCRLPASNWAGAQPVCPAFLNLRQAGASTSVLEDISDKILGCNLFSSVQWDTRCDSWNETSWSHLYEMDMLFLGMDWTYGGLPVTCPSIGLLTLYMPLSVAAEYSTLYYMRVATHVRCEKLLPCITLSYLK